MPSAPPRTTDSASAERGARICDALATALRTINHHLAARVPTPYSPTANADSPDERLLPANHTTRSAGAASELAPASLAVLAGAFPTPLVLVTIVGVRSLWAAALSVEASWILIPAALMYRYPASRARFVRALRAACRRPQLQLIVGLALCLLTIGVFMLAVKCAELLLSDEVRAQLHHVRAQAAAYGLSSSQPAAVGLLSAWFVAVNPTLEELFWRIYLHDALTQLVCAKTSSRGGLGVLLATSALYASYHSSVLFVFLEAPMAVAALFGLVGYGAFLQILADRIGVGAAILAHTGGDAVVVIGLTDAIWDFYR